MLYNLLKQQIVTIVMINSCRSEHEQKAVSQEEAFILRRIRLATESSGRIVVVADWGPSVLILALR